MNSEEKKVPKQVQAIISNGTIIAFVFLLTGIGVIYFMAQGISKKWSTPSAVRVTDEQMEYLNQ